MEARQLKKTDQQSEQQRPNVPPGLLPKGRRYVPLKPREKGQQQQHCQTPSGRALKSIGRGLQVVSPMPKCPMGRARRLAESVAALQPGRSPRLAESVAAQRPGGGRRLTELVEAQRPPPAEQEDIDDPPNTPIYDLPLVDWAEVRASLPRNYWRTYTYQR